MSGLRYWLGPWARGGAPRGVTVREIAGLPAGSRLYAPSGRVAGAAVLISPGLHYDGPRDPRLDRFARILAAAGNVVVSPASPALMQLQLAPRAITDLAAAFTALRAQPECRHLPVRVVGISVGSLAALRLAAVAAIDSLALIGGYADPVALIRALTSSAGDPLNAPAAFLTLFDDSPGLRAGWQRMILATWPHPELKRPGSTAHHAIARAIADELALEPAARELFLVGCGARPGAWECAARALAADRFAYLDPRPHLATVRCPVSIIHGIADPVIPFAQAAAIGAAMPRAVQCVTHATGLLAHSGAVAPRGRVRAIARELRTFHHICRSLEGARV